MMSQEQRSYLLFSKGSLWRQVCAKQGWEFPADGERHRIYAELHDNGNGDLAHTSFSKFTQQDFDVVKARFLALIDPDNVQAQLDQLGQRRKRLEHSCMDQARACAEHDWAAYMQTIMNAKFERNDLDELTEAQLVMLQHTLYARAQAKRRKAKESKKETAGNPF